MSTFDIMIAALRQRCLRLLPAVWRIPRQREAPDETVLECLGAVEIRCLTAATFVGTCVHGDPARARETALRRLITYLNGDNLRGAVMQAVRPVIQQQLGPLLWRISLRLPTVPNAVVAPVPQAPKVKLWSAQPGFLAVVRMPGWRPAYSAVAGGDAIVLNALANTEWIATGAPMIRMHASGPLPWFTGKFEVAVPVAPRRHDETHDNADFIIVDRLPAA